MLVKKEKEHLESAPSAPTPCPSAPGAEGRPGGSDETPSSRSGWGWEPPGGASVYEVRPPAVCSVGAVPVSVRGPERSGPSAVTAWGRHEHQPPGAQSCGARAPGGSGCRAPEAGVLVLGKGRQAAGASVS